MNKVAILLVLISAFFHAVRNYYTKKAYDKQVFLWLFVSFAVLLNFPIFLYYVYNLGLGPKVVITLGLISGVLNSLYLYFLSRAYDRGDLSHVYPIIRSAPPIILILAVIFLKEQVTLLGVIGILLVALGVYSINMKKISDFFDPLNSLITEKPTQFAIIAMFMVAFYSIVDKVNVSLSHPLIVGFLLNGFTILFFGIFVILNKEKKIIINEWVKNKKAILFNGILEFISYSLILFAFSMDNVSYVVGFRQISIFFGVLMGGHLLKEKHIALRLVASLVIFIGAFMIGIA
tara:strand:+ start:9023 stop:9892 length:870 start_codon:yes stop_codon:yes gene_type:complete